MSWPVPSVTGVVVDGEQRVLLRREGASWRLPKTKFPGGATWVEALQRALQTESGLEALGWRLVGLYTGEPESQVVASFLVTEFRGDAQSAEWFASDALPELPAADRQRIEDALGFDGVVQQR